MRDSAAMFGGRLRAAGPFTGVPKRRPLCSVVGRRAPAANWERALRDSLEHTVLREYGLVNSRTQLLDVIQQGLECCGAEGPRDWQHSAWARAQRGEAEEPAAARARRRPRLACRWARPGPLLTCGACSRGRGGRARRRGRGAGAGGGGRGLHGAAGARVLGAGAPGAAPRRWGRAAGGARAGAAVAWRCGSRTPHPPYKP
ncbi:unnamed protein product [Arctia plantaginis]|uniref:Uncharacterized protein n=1 Tax=Arctia plantaginis TaxID=874455 RepID=A0A8S1B6Y8_ARCPL|nr:unnamed protein product [Arctia plantaginis]